MKNLNTVAKGLAIISLVLFALTAQAQKGKDVTKEIAKANEGFMTAFNNQDANALAANYTSDGKLYPSNSDVIEGMEGIAGFWSAIMSAGIKKAKLETVSATAYGNTAIEEGRYQLFIEGDQQADQGKYIVIWKKQNGQWKLYQDIWNTSVVAAQ